MKNAKASACKINLKHFSRLSEKENIRKDLRKSNFNLRESFQFCFLLSLKIFSPLRWESSERCLCWLFGKKKAINKTQLPQRPPSKGKTRVLIRKASTRIRKADVLRSSSSASSCLECKQCSQQKENSANKQYEFRQNAKQHDH